MNICRLDISKFTQTGGLVQKSHNLWATAITSHLHKYKNFDTEMKCFDMNISILDSVYYISLEITKNTQGRTNKTNNFINKSHLLQQALLDKFI